MKKNIMIFFLLVLAGLWCNVPAGQAADITMNVSPVEVLIGTFYNGTTVTVSGSIPAGAETVIRLSGASEDLHLKKKGKVAGLLWMNTGDLTFHNAPGVYKIYTSKALDDLTSSPAAEFGFTALVNQIEISPANEDKEFLINEFVRLKQKDAQYSRDDDSIRFGAPEGGMKSYQASIDIPSGMRQGSYEVDMAVVQDGKILTTLSKPLELKQISFPAQLTSMAFEHALWYGIMAVVVALVAGLVIGLVFSDKGGSH